MMEFKRPSAYAAAVCLMLLASGSAYGAAECFLDDPSENTPLSTPIQAGGTGDDFGGDDLCGHEVSGTNCVLEVNVDSEGSLNTDCLELDGGVTVEMNEHTIDCPNAQAPCGSAIRIGGGGTGSNKNVIEEGNITGCWEYGIEGAGGADNWAKEMIVDLEGDTNCTGNGDYGIEGVNKIELSVVRNCDEICMGVIATDSKIADSIAHNCGVGVEAGSGLGGTTLIDNVVVLNNTENLNENGIQSGGNIDLRDSVFRDATTCNFRNRLGTCKDSDVTDVVDLLGFNFIDDTLIP